jgi:fumarylacetoacetase
VSRTIDDTHEPTLRSWVTSAADHPDFPIQNLPFGRFRRRGDPKTSVGVAIGDQVVDLRAWVRSGALHLEEPSAAGGTNAALIDACEADSLNPLMALPSGQRLALRGSLSRWLRADSRTAAGGRGDGAAVLVAMKDVELLVPADIGDYTDFYASVFHASNVGALFRPDNPLLPNYKWVPIGYHGRASSIVVSGTPVSRPAGQTRPEPNAPPTFGASRRLDYELELGLFVGPGNRLGSPIPMADAERHIFGVCLVNDWSARDIQAWEYQPLGPFLAKNFATSISPWVVTLEALAPFRIAPRARPADDPPPLAYLDDPEDRRAGALDIQLEVSLASAAMRQRGIAPLRLALSRFADLYWTPAQLLTHHTSNGCNLQPGDLLASGTVSGPAPGSLGCLLELTRGGRAPVTLPTGEERTFLEDGDEVTLRGWCERDGAARIGLGECSGVVTAR